MVTVNGNEITLALGIIAAILIISSIAALLIKDFCHKRAHRDEEKALNAETDNAPIELPARGFSLLRAFNRAGYHRAGAQEEPINQSPSRASSMLRSLSGLTRFRSKRAIPRKDFENQITAYGGPSAAEIRDEIRARKSMADAETANTVHTVYQSREQQWSQVALDSPQDANGVLGRNDVLDPPASVVSPLEPTSESDRNIRASSADAWKMVNDSAPGQQYRAFRGPSSVVGS